MNGPWINAAILCQEVMRPDNGPPSIRGFVDSLQLVAGRPSPKPGERARIQGTALLALALTAGHAIGRQELRIEVEADDGTKQAVATEILYFDGSRDGQLFGLPLNIAFGRSGDYWINVLLNGVVVTRVAFDVMIHWQDDRS